MGKILGNKNKSYMDMMNDFLVKTIYRILELEIG